MGSHAACSRSVRTAVLLAAILGVASAPEKLAGQSGPPPLAPLRGLIDHQSVAVNGMPSMSSSINAVHAISGDGRYMVFESDGSDLVYDDTNYVADIFLRDRALGTTARMSVGDDGSQSTGHSTMASISTNGRHVVFSSGAPNLVSDDTNDHFDVFVRDLDANRTVRVSVASDGSQLDGDAYGAAISANGRFVAFLSTTTQIAPPESFQQLQAYVRDRDFDGNGIFDEEGGTSTSHASVSLSGGSLDAAVYTVRISSDGRFVMFESTASNAHPAGNASGQSHVYVRDRQADETILVDRSVTGGSSQLGIAPQSADMTDDGRFITYGSMSNDIVPAASNGISQIFLYDANAEPADRTKLVTSLGDGTLADGYSYATSVSGDGRYVAFLTLAANLVKPGPAEQGSGALVVRDMYDSSAFMRVDVMPNGDAFDGQYLGAPAISADGTAIAFYSSADNALDGGNPFDSYHVFVVTAFAATPQFASYPGTGGAGAIDVSTTAVSGWSASTYDSWIVLDDGSSYAPGSRLLRYHVLPNEAGVVRDGRIRVGSTFVAIHQEGGGDTTPPVITPIVTGSLGGDGWYVSNVTVSWTIEDPESPIVFTGYGCAPVTIAVDTIYAPITCEAGSQGGPTSNTFVVRRDTTPPAINISVPLKTVYAAGSIVTPSFHCADSSGYSHVATCRITQGSTPLDTTPGWHVFTVSTSDRAGNAATRSVDYFVGTGQCVVPNESLEGWWPFERNTIDVLTALPAMPNPSTTLQYASGVVGQSWQGQGMNYLDTNEFDRLDATNGLTVAAWVRPTGQIGESGTIVSKPAQYRVARFLDGTLRWAFSQATGFAWVNTGVVLPNNAWTHVAVSFDGTAGRTYVNGRLAHTAALSGPLVNAGDPSASMTIGGRADANAFYFGWIDELQVFTTPLTAAEVEAIALAGNGGVCAPQNSTLTVTVPDSVPYGATFAATATLRDAAGQPVAGRTLTFESFVSPNDASVGAASGMTDTAGQVQVQLPTSLNAVPGTFATGVIAKFSGDARYALSKGVGSVTLVKATSVIDWPAPSSIVYGTVLNGTQLNASANTGGTFTYSPAGESMLDAGTHTLSVEFVPADTDRWTTASATTTLVVTKAQPVVTVTGGTFTYDGHPHPGSGVAVGVLGEALSPVQVIYDGASESAPVNAGTHTVRAIYAGSTNYSSAQSTDALLTINKAPLAITANATVKPFGAPLPAFSPSASGFRNGDTFASLAGTLSFATQATAASPVGVYAVTPQGVSSNNYAIAFVSGSLSIVPASTATVVAASSNPSGYNQAVTFSAVVSAVAPGAGMPSGSVEFLDGTTMLGTAPLVNGTAALTTNGFAVGGHTIAARYSGDPSFAPSSGASTLTVNSLSQSSTTTLSSSANPSAVGQSITLTASVQASGPLSGSVAFYDGSVLIGTAALSSGTAKLTTSSLGAGGHALTARYLGNGVVPPSISPALAQHVRFSDGKTRGVDVSLDAWPYQAAVGSELTLKATVSGVGRQSPTGQVIFLVNGTVVGQATLRSDDDDEDHPSAVATFRTSALPRGSHFVEMVYLGDSSYRADTTSITVSVN